MTTSRRRSPDVEKQIAELQKKLEALKNPTPASVSLNGGTIPESRRQEDDLALDRPGQHGRPHHRHRRRGVRPHHLLHRHRLRRTPEDHQQRHHLQPPLRQGEPPSPSATSRWRRPIPTSSGSAPARTTPATRSPTATASTRAPTAARSGPTWGSSSPSRSARSSSTRRSPNTVYVGALGRLYGPNEERGLFKTEDGGKTWKHILKVDDRTGVIDMRMDPFNPDTLLVGMWETQARRLRHHLRPALRLVQPRSIRTRGHLRPRRRPLPLHRCGQDLEEAHRRKGRERPAHRQDRPHRHRLLAQDQGTRLRHHRHRERRQGPAAPDGLHGPLQRQREGRRRPRHR